jgi:hypothetical protein
MAMPTMTAMMTGALTRVPSRSTPPATHGVQEGAKGVSMPVAVLTATMMTMMNLF